MSLNIAEAWPPPYPEDTSLKVARRQVWSKTKQVHRQKGGEIPRDAKKFLVLQLHDSIGENPSKLTLLHGIALCTHQRVLHAVPQLESLDIMNMLDPLDRNQIGPMLTWEYIVKKITDRTGMEPVYKEDEPEKSVYEQELFADTPWAQEEEFIRPHELEGFDDFLEMIDHQVQLRNIYKAIIKGELTEDLVAGLA